MQKAHEELSDNLSELGWTKHVPTPIGCILLCHLRKQQQDKSSGPEVMAQR